jgi:cell division septum initiation protein DivIVA
MADAQRYSRELAEQARRGRDEILAEAKARAVMVLDEAHRQASTAAEEGRPSTEPLSEERRDLEREIAYLRTFSDVYRTHLRSYLEALLRNVEEWEHSENASLPSRAPLPRSR